MCTPSTHRQKQKSFWLRVCEHDNSKLCRRGDGGDPEESRLCTQSGGTPKSRLENTHGKSGEDLRAAPSPGDGSYRLGPGRFLSEQDSTDDSAP